MIENTRQVAHTAYVVFSLVFLLTCTRFLLRRLKHERIYPDDWLMIVALVVLAGQTSSYPLFVSVFLPLLSLRTFLICWQQIWSGDGINGSSPDETIADSKMEFSL